MATEITPTTQFGVSQLFEHTPPAVKKFIQILLAAFAIYGVVMLNAPNLIPASFRNWMDAIVPVVALLGNMVGVKKEGTTTP